MQRPLAFIAKATGTAAVCLLAYRGFQLYYKNDIIIYVTEVVHLPETACQRRQPHADSKLTLTIEGKVEMETCLMNSYRFLMKLLGHVRTAFPDANKTSTSGSAQLVTMSPRSTRHRVLLIQTSDNYNNFGDDDSVSNASVSGKAKHKPTLLITSVDPAVDAYEAESSGLITFTPACVSEGLLCRYICTTGPAEEGSSGAQGGSIERGNSVSSFAKVSPKPRFVPQGGANGLGSIYVRGCFLESDSETAYCQRLTVELEFIRPVFGARVVIRMPSKYCRLQRSSTGGVGTVAQLTHQPRKCVWDIGEVTEAMCSVPQNDAVGATSVGELMPGTSCARLELVFEQPPPGIASGEEDDAYPSGSSADEDDDENRFSSTVSGAKSASRRCTRPASGRRWFKSIASSGLLKTNSDPAESTSRSRKREERARKVAEKAARILEATSSSDVRSRGGASSIGVPSVEVVFSVNQLVSGTAVKKLQVLQETPNWVPRSRLDRLVLRRLLPSLEKMKLKKLAHYTTWFVQPVEVSQL